MFTPTVLSRACLFYLAGHASPSVAVWASQGIPSTKPAAEFTVIGAITSGPPHPMRTIRDPSTFLPPTISRFLLVPNPELSKDFKHFFHLGHHSPSTFSFSIFCVLPCFLCILGRLGCLVCLVLGPFRTDPIVSQIKTVSTMCIAESIVRLSNLSQERLVSNMLGVTSQVRARVLAPTFRK